MKFYEWRGARARESCPFIVSSSSSGTIRASSPFHCITRLQYAVQSRTDICPLRPLPPHRQSRPLSSRLSRHRQRGSCFSPPFVSVSAIFLFRISMHVADQTTVDRRTRMDTICWRGDFSTNFGLPSLARAAMTNGTTSAATTMTMHARRRTGADGRPRADCWRDVYCPKCRHVTDDG